MIHRYEATLETIAAYRALSPDTLADALYVDADGCVYDGAPPDEVLSACPAVSEIDDEDLAELKGGM